MCIRDSSRFRQYLKFSATHPQRYKQETIASNDRSGKGPIWYWQSINMIIPFKLDGRQNLQYCLGMTNFEDVLRTRAQGRSILTTPASSLTLRSIWLGRIAKPWPGEEWGQHCNDAGPQQAEVPAPAEVVSVQRRMTHCVVLGGLAKLMGLGWASSFVRSNRDTMCLLR